MACFVLGLVGCSNDDTDVIRFGVSVAPSTLDPRFATDAASMRLIRLLYRPLVEFDEASRPVPGLADWERVSGTTYRFHLQPGRAEFHDGSPVTAEDVQATYEEVLDRDTASPHRGSLRHIEAIRAVDEDTVEFRLSREDALFPGRLNIGIMPARLLAEDHRFNRRPVGSGPFRFLAWPESGRVHIARRRDGQEFAFLEVSDPTVRTLKLMRGEIDLLQNDLSPELVDYLESQEEIQVATRPGNRFTYLGFNLEDEFTGEHRIRKAVAHALDREALIETLMGGRARLAGGMLPPEHWAGHGGEPGYAYDPARARALLEEAGYAEGPGPRLIYKTSSDPLRLRIATVIQHQLAEVGFRVSLRSYDWGTFYGDIQAGRFQMYALSWVGINSPDIFEYVFHSRSVPPDGANRNRYQSEAVDDWIETAASAPDLESQADLYRRIQAQVLGDLPYVPLWYESHFHASRGVTGYTVGADGTYDGLIAVRRSGGAGDAGRVAHE